MNNLQIFNHPEFGKIEIIEVDGREWFGAAEAAKALSFSNPHSAIQNHIDEDDLTVHEVIDSIGRSQHKKFTNESGLYSLIFGAAKQGNNPDIQSKAKEFKRWVTHDVLPSIRRTGSYSVQPKTQAELLLMYAEQFVQMESRVNQVETTITAIQDTFLQRDEDWRSQINKTIAAAAIRMGGNFQELRTQSYASLEERGRCDLNTRLRNLKDRLDANGATKTKINSMTKMDVIEADPRLKEIYTTIVKELSIGSIQNERRKHE